MFTRQTKQPRSLQWLGALLAFVALQMWVYSVAQPLTQSGNGRGDDGEQYAKMAEDVLAGRPIVAAPPFVYRIGVPWLAAQYARVTGVSIDAAFQQLNGVAVVGLMVLVYSLARTVASPPWAGLAAAMYSAAWFSYTRMLFFCPIIVDPAWSIAVIGGLLLMAPQRLSTPAFVGLSVLSTVAPLIRETGLALPLTYALSRKDVMAHLRRLGAQLLGVRVSKMPVPAVEIRRSLIVVMLGLLSWAFTRRVVHPNKAYSIVAAIEDSIVLNSSWHLIVSALLAWGGPLLALLVVSPASTREHARRQPQLAVFAGLVVALAYVGGTNTVRFLSWTAPVVLAWECGMLERLLRRDAQHGNRGWIALAAMALLSTAGYLAWIHPFGAYYTDYSAWALYGGLQFSPPRFLWPGSMVVLGLLLLATAVLSGAAARSSGAPRDA